jgi:hypothetical protein
MWGPAIEKGGVSFLLVECSQKRRPTSRKCGVVRDPHTVKGAPGNVSFDSLNVKCA